MCRAIFDAHRSGALVIAAGAAAAYLSDWAIVDRAAFHRMQRNPRNMREHTLARGLGWVRGLIVDASGAPHGGVSRLLTISARSQAPLALYLDGPVAWIVRNGAEPAAVVRGSGAALVLDLHTARRRPKSISGGRLALLFEGDRWDAREHRVPTATQSLEPGAPVLERSLSVAATLEARDLRSELTHEFAPSRATTSRLSAPNLNLSLRADSNSTFGAAALKQSASRAGIAFDLDWDEPSGS